MNLLKSKLLILVCLAINHTQKNIAFPDNASDLREIKSKFHDIGKIPNCVGAVDGTLIPNKGLSGTDEPAYVCRKNFAGPLDLCISFSLHVELQCK